MKEAMTRGGKGRKVTAGWLLAGAALAGVIAVIAAVLWSSEPQRRTPPRSPVPGVTQAPTPETESLALSVSDNGRYLVDASGDPFFWLADTAWSMPLALTREEVTRYLDTRARQGYTVIQTVAVFPHAGGPGPNRYGDSPYQGELTKLAVTEGANPNDPQEYDYWDHLDYIIAEAHARGLRVALFPAWSDNQVGSLLRKDNAADYGAFLGERYGDQVIWVLGGDEHTKGYEDIWRELARGIAVGATGREDYSTTLMSYHPLGDDSSVRYFHDDEWLDLNMIQGGHCRRYDVRNTLIDEAYQAHPPKPFIDGEPIYEEHPFCWKPEDGYSNALDVRRDAYWSVFAGAAGHTYGHHTVWQFTGGNRPRVSHPRGDWVSALDSEAAWQMRHLRTLMETRKWWTAQPATDVITSNVGRTTDRLRALKATDGSWLMVYSPDGRPFDVNLSVLASASARLSWFDPRTGETTPAGTASGETTFTPPQRGTDWVLIADRM